MFFQDSLLLAQSGPGGVGNSVSNVLWLSADHQVYNNAGTTLAATTDNVQQWNDRSGNLKNASQAIAANRPNYITNVLNGFPVIRFSAGNDHMMATTISTANVASVWAVAAYASLPSSNPGILIGAPAGTGTNVGAGSKSIGMWVSSAAGTQVWGRGIQSNATSRDISTVTSLNVSNFYIVNNVYRGATSINQFVNNAAAGNNNSHNGTLSSWTDVTIGRQGSESWNGDIAEVIFYNTEVNSAQRILIDNYLSAKYGLSLSTNDVYVQDIAGNGNFDFEVAGIGRVDASNIHNDAQGTGIVRILNPSNLGNDEFLMWGHNNASTQASNFTDIPTGVQARMARVWRVSELSSALVSVDVGSVDIRFDLASLGSITASDLRLLVDTDNDGVFTDETGISGASLVSGTIYQFTGVTALTNNVRFSLGTINTSQTPLPIELLSFNASLTEEKVVELTWSTATEKNNDFFEIEKSLNGMEWEGVIMVPGAKNSTTRKYYLCKDEHPYNQTSYYRLKQVDLNGRFTHSPIITLDLENRLDWSVDLYPNPVTNQITIQGPTEELQSTEVFDLLGTKQDIRHITNYLNANKMVIDLTSWKSGIYLFRSKTEIRKFIKN